MEEKPQEQAETKNEANPPEVEEPKKRFVSINDITRKEYKITSIFSKSKKKLEESKPGLFFRPHNCEFKSQEYISLFQYEGTFPLKVKQEFSFIYDCLNFICYQPKDEEDSLNKEKYINKLQTILSYLKDKGTILLLLDEFYIQNFFQNFLSVLGTEYKTKLFINFYFLEFHSFLFLVSIQKMGDSEKPIIAKDIKILITEYFTKTKLIGSSTLSTIPDYLNNSLAMMRSYRFQCETNYNRIKTLHPGQVYELRLKSSPLNQDPSYIVTILDSSNAEYQKKNQCFAVAVSSEITHEIIFYKQNSFNKMSNQLKASRLIILESALLSPCNIKELALDLHEEMDKMKPEGFKDHIQVSLWENHIKEYTVFEDDKYLIKDTEDKKRQLYLKDNKFIIQGEEKTKLASKTNIANPAPGIVYYPIETLDKYKENRVMQCVDDSFVHGFYEQSLLCTVYYIDLNKFPKNSIKILDIGAGLGSLSFHFYRLFKSMCEIYNIERNKEMYELGMKYFGYKNYDKDNKVTWLIEEGINCIEKMAKYEEINANKTKKLNEKKYGNKLNYFDLICNEINDLYPKENTIPSKDFFDDNYLENVKNLLKSYGIYIVKLVSSNYKSFYECYLQLEKHFMSIFNIPSEGGLASIYFCFKEKIDIKEYQDKFIKNRDIVEKGNIIDHSVIKTFANAILVKLEDMTEQRKKMEENAKKL